MTPGRIRELAERCAEVAAAVSSSHSVAIIEGVIHTALADSWQEATSKAMLRAGRKLGPNSYNLDRVFTAMAAVKLAEIEGNEG